MKASPLDRVIADTPMVEAMGLLHVQSDPVMLQAPFDRCRNQLGVAFGGAIATGLTLCGWVAVVESLESVFNQECNPFVATASQRFLAPCTSSVLSFTAPIIHSETHWAGAREAGQRIRVSVTTQLIDEQGRLCADNQLEFAW